jgi:ABC-type cobalamin/Fe3+-siderophores transport system ATPase subunit
MLIEISNLSFAYDREPVLESISLNIQSGEQWAIIGKNGSGKSTLLKCIGGIEKASSGRIAISGRNINDFSIKERARYISYIPQFVDRNLPFIVYDYVMMSRYPYQKALAIPDKTDHEIVRESLSLTETEEFKNRRINSLSGGEQQRVFLAGAVAQQSKIVLLDEPTTFLDPLQARNIARALKRLIQRYSITIISVTHELNYSITLHNKVLALKDKKVFYSGSIDALMNSDLMIAEKLFDTNFEKITLSSGVSAIIPILQ